MTGFDHLWYSIRNMFCDTINFFLTSLEQLRIENDILQIIGMAFLTILIPVAIAVFGDKKEYEILDKNVILDHVVKAKFVLVYFGLIFCPSLFWNISPGWLRFVELVVWIVGVYFVTKILVNSYRWMKGNRLALRFCYLKELKDLKDLEEAWRSVWQTEKINPQNEAEFFKIFSSTIDTLIKNDKRNP